MSSFYSIDSTRVSHREYWWGTRSPAVLLGWLLKWLRVRIPSSADDPNAESTMPFVVEALPAEIAQRFEPLAVQLGSLGFLDPVYHVIHDTGTATTIFWATYRHSSGEHFARIHQRIWQQTKPADRGTFVLFFTVFVDGTFLGSSSGKPDLDSPGTVPMLRRHGAAPADLWTAHLEFVAAKRQSPVRPVRFRQELLDASERLHILLRDFHLSRGVFRPRSGAEEATATAVAASLQQATSSGLQNPGVVAEVERIQTQRPGWGNAIGILVVSLLAFFGAGAAQRDWKFTLWLIPVLLFHEFGHWLAMKIFGYRNLRMFFIPLFGAAVTGQHWNVPGWKKAIVSLAGPVPGILLGVVLTLVGLITKREWLNEGAFLILFINGFNLLPVLPLDGGHVLHAILFCRNRWLDISFRVIAIAGLLLLAFSGSGRFLMYIAIVMVVGLPVAFKIGKVVDALRRTPFPPPLRGEDRIPSTTADTIASALKAELPAKINEKTLALHTVNAFETLNARPPGVLGTLVFLTVHGGSAVLAILCGFLLILDKHGGGLGNFAEAAMRQPKHTFTCGAIERWAGVAAPSVASRLILISTLKDHAAANREFRSFIGRLPAEASLTLVGDSVLLALPTADDTARERWFAELQRSDTNTFAVLTNQTFNVSVMFVAPDSTVATNLASELSEYFEAGRYGDIIAPWSPEASGAKYAAAREARRAWHAIATNATSVWASQATKDLNLQILAARKRGAQAEMERLQKNLASVRDKEQAAAYERMKGRGIDADLVDLYAKISALEYTNRTARTALERQVTLKLGAVSEGGDAPAKVTPNYGAASGFVRQQGFLIELWWVSLRDAPVGLPALFEWLCEKRCGTIRYDIGSFGLDQDDSSEEQ